LTRDFARLRIRDGKTIRFGDLVRESGRPHVATLWVDPEKDPLVFRLGIEKDYDRARLITDCVGSFKLLQQTDNPRLPASLTPFSPRRASYAECNYGCEDGRDPKGVLTPLLGAVYGIVR